MADTNESLEQNIAEAEVKSTKKIKSCPEGAKKFVCNFPKCKYDPNYLSPKLNPNSCPPKCENIVGTCSHPELNCAGQVRYCSRDDHIKGVGEEATVFCGYTTKLKRYN